VLALEADPQMRAVFPRGLANVSLQDGSAEAIPAADRCADLVAAFDSWHGFRQPRATREASRVLRPGGTLGATWNVPDTSVAWVRQLWGSIGGAPDEQRDLGRFNLAADAPFSVPEYYTVHWHWRLRLDDLLGLLGACAPVLAMEPIERSRHLAGQRELIKRHVELGADGAIDVPFSTVCWRTRRLSGPFR
jgi:SAM-dependent methyltransferase